MIFYCIRHGQSVSNAVGKIQGQSDIPLSDLGRRQAAAVAEPLVGRSVEAIYASPLLRAYQTAEVIATRLGLPIAVDDRLKEIHAGVFQDKNRKEVEQLYPEELARWLSEDLHFRIPGGETRLELLERGSAVFREIAARSEHQRVAVVAHGRLLVVTLKALLGIPPEEPPVALENGSITTIESTADGAFRLLELDEIDHLQTVGTGSSGDL